MIGEPNETSVAVIDDGIPDMGIVNQLAAQDDVSVDLEGVEVGVLTHGACCAWVIRAMCPNVDLCDINAFSRGTARAADLISALQSFSASRCLVANCSIGTAHGTHRTEIENEVGEALRCGKLLIAAASSGRYYSFPACCPGVISVVQNRSIASVLSPSEDPRYLLESAFRSSVASALVSGLVSRAPEEYLRLIRGPQDELAAALCRNMTEDDAARFCRIAREIGLVREAAIAHAAPGVECGSARDRSAQEGEQDEQ